MLVIRRLFRREDNSIADIFSDHVATNNDINYSQPNNSRDDRCVSSVPVYPPNTFNSTVSNYAVFALYLPNLSSSGGGMKPIASHYT